MYPRPSCLKHGQPCETKGFLPDSPGPIAAREASPQPGVLEEASGRRVPYAERTTIGHDPEPDVHVLVHGRRRASKSSVHDHGPYWVIWDAEVGLQKEFLNEPGQAA